MRSLTPRPVMLIHDMWLHANVLTSWVRLLGEHGRSAVVPRWPGEQPTVAESRVRISCDARPAIRLAGLIDHYAALARSFPTEPVVVGHGFGALVAEVLLGRGQAWAAAAIEPAVLRGAQPLSWPQLVAGTMVLGPSTTRSRWMTLTRHQFGLIFGTAGSDRATPLCQATLYGRVGASAGGVTS